MHKIQRILVALTVATLMVGTCGCSMFTPWSTAPPTTPSSQPASQSEYTDPEWTFPSGNAHSPQPLPDIAGVVQQVMPSVVSVMTEMVVYDVFNQQYTQSAAGSGVIIDSEGYIITNNHVVENAKEVQVELLDGSAFPASIVGSDALTDLAVIKVAEEGLSYATVGDSPQLAVGEWVVAIGNALGEGISASEGIVSRLDVSVSVGGNTLRDLIQTTAAINPGNSGGPLVNMSGEVIGLNSVKVADIGIEGMSYAISMNSAEPIVSALIQQGYVTRPWLGVSLYTVDRLVALMNDLSVQEGVLVLEVSSNSPAEAAGLRKGDVIIQFDEKKTITTDDLLQAILGSEVGQTVEITFVREDKTRKTSAQLQESPPPWG